MSAINDMVREAINGEGVFSPGDNFRICHTEIVNDKICTPSSEPPAMTVTRTSNGWIYHCHRCHTSGAIYDSGLDPAQTKARVKALKNSSRNRMTANITLPVDFIPMLGDDACPVPYQAWHWFWQYDLTKDEIVKFNCGWSDNYNRVIVPLYEYAHLGDGVAKELVGWIGREGECRSKEERKTKGIPKYLTRAKKGQRRYFVAPGDESKVAICEDAISAMKINLATGYTVIALLNTSVNTDLMRWLRGKTVYLWLDGDMLANSVQTVTRMQSLGLYARNIHTPKDPKCYDSLFIREQIREKTSK